MDLSSHGNTQPFRQKLTSECPVMVGTVPVYDAVIHYQRDLNTLTAEDFIDVVRLHAEDGVDFVTLHCGINKKTLEQIKNGKRKMNIVSRGGSLIYAWMSMTGEENPFYSHFDEILDICAEHDVTISLGDAALIREVFDKVLVGYTVTGAEVVPGETARVQVALVPWADRVQTVNVETHVDGMPPEVESMVRQDLAGVEQVFDHALLGLPIAAADWTNGVLKREVNHYLDEHLPEFRADFDVTADTAAQVKLTVYPRVPVVRTVDLSMRSNTMP